MRLQAESWTPSAREWLERTAGASVLHVFRDVCNLINEEGRILSLVAAGVDRTAFCLRMAPSVEFANSGGFSGIFDASLQAAVGPDSIGLGRLIVEIEAPRLWNPVPDWEALREHGRLGSAGRLVLLERLANESPPGSLAPLGVRSGRNGDQELVESGILSVARPAAERLADGLRQRSGDDLRQAAASLAGLGAGLTPSGDDYLVGCLHALWSAVPEAEARSMGQNLIDGAVHRTTALSGAWLQAAARGEAAEHWHSVLRAMASDDLGGLESAASNLVRIGHSSGADSLAGFLSARTALEQADR